MKSISMNLFCGHNISSFQDSCFLNPYTQHYVLGWDMSSLRDFLSNHIAYKIIEENADIGVLKVAEQKVEYLKSKAK